MSGIESTGGFSANVPATEKLSTIRTRFTEKVTEKIHGKVDEKLKSAGVIEETREAVLADVTQVIERQMSSGTQPDPKAMKERIGGIFEKHGLTVPDGLQQGAGTLGLVGGYTGTGTAGSSQFDAIQSLIANLEAVSNESSDNQRSPNEYASSFLNGFRGIDVQA